MLHEQRFNTGTVEINYVEGPPSGPPFVLLHAGGTRWQDGEALISLLSARWHIYAPDLRGHGKSGRVPGHYRLPDYAMDVAAFLTHVVTEPAVLFGHSLSGTIAAMVAAQHPQSVRALVVGDVAPFAEGHASWAAAQRDVLLRLRDLASSGRSVAEIEAALKEIPLPVAGQAAPVRAEDAFGPDHPWFPAMAGHLSQLDPAMVMGVLDEGMMDGYDADQLLPQIGCPVLLLQADPATGGELSNEEVERAMTLLPQAVNIRVESTSHGLHTRRPHTVLRVVEGCLDETVRVESSRQENR